MTEQKTKSRKTTRNSITTGVSPVETQFSDREQSFELIVLKSLRRIIRSLDLYSRKLKSEFGLTVPQLICLSAILRGEPISSIELSQQVQLSPSTIVGILDRLQKMGFINRDRSVTDRRLVLLSSTALGNEVLSGAPSPLQDRLTIALKDLSVSDQKTIAESLERVVELMQAQDIEVAPILTLENADFSMTATDAESKNP